MMALRDVEAGLWLTNATSHREPQQQRHSGSVLVKLAFNRGAQDRYTELMNLKMEVSNILETKAYNFPGSKRPSDKNEFGQEGLQLILTFTHEEKEKCSIVKFVFFFLQCCIVSLSHDKIGLLQYCKLHRNNNESAPAWMGRLRTKAAEC